MSSNKKKSSLPIPAIVFIVCFALMSGFLVSPLTLVGLAVNLAVSSGAAILVKWFRKKRGQKENIQNAAGRKEENVANTKKTSERVSDSSVTAKTTTGKRIRRKSYGEKIDPILEESDRAIDEMQRLKSTIRDQNVQNKIDQIIEITEKISQDAIDDPSDIPQIKKFFRYYLPTTIKLLNAYDRMSSQGIEGENIDKSIANINEMLDVAIAAYKKRLDSLFENQALDIETDIDVMNQMLEREGLSDKKDFTGIQAAAGAAQQSSALAAQQKG